MLQDPALAADLCRRLELTPFSREEFALAYRPHRGKVERARRLVVRSYMGFGSDGATGEYRTGFRSNSNRSGSTPATDWRNFPGSLPAIIDRLRGVVIERAEAIRVMQRHDSVETLHYVDPPYPLDVRSRTHRRPGGGTYRHELTLDQHGRLLTALKGLTGMVMLSGYSHPLYEQELEGWRRIERRAHADGARDRTEVLWLNPAAAALGSQPSLLEAAE